jgi:hypothetical protein
LIKLKQNIIGILIFSIFSFVSCVQDVELDGPSGEVVQIEIQFKESGKSSDTRGIHNPDEYDGTDIDSDVVSFRVLAFETTGSKNCVSNSLYQGMANRNSLRHPIKVGDYHFVFIANEPAKDAVHAELDGVANYSDLNAIAFTDDSFTSEQYIPMTDVIEDVTVLKSGEVIVNSTQQSTLFVKPDRLAVRVDVELEAVEDLTDEFTGVTFSNIPNLVPLMATYTGSTPIQRTQMRTFTLADNAGYFENYTPENTNVWGRKVKRIILPSSVFSPIGDDSKAVKITVNMKNAYNPDGLLKIEESPINYTLRKNLKLDLNATIKLPLELNIKAEDWVPVSSGWNTDQIYLNLSQTEVNITDFNGARITIDSNAGSLRVLGYVDPDTGEILTGDDGWVNGELNDLMWPKNWGRRMVYVYNSNTEIGTGYMDIIAGNRPQTPGTNSYIIALGARRKETWEGEGLTLIRHIKVNVNIYGDRYDFTPSGNYNENGVLNMWGTSYVGAYYRNDEVGERIIHGAFAGEWWKAIVGDEDIPGSGNPRDWIQITATPSFDPKAGTDDPGDPEDFPVVPSDHVGTNGWSREDGTTASGANRVYFRIGLKSKNTSGVPRYGYIDVYYTYDAVSDEPALTDPNVKHERIYVRQGEQYDYVMTKDDPMTINGTNFSTRDANVVRKFSPYNLTAQAMKDNPYATNNYIQLGATRTGAYVQYPTQAGGLFQWATPSLPAYRRFVYYPRALVENEFANLGAIPNSTWTPITLDDNDFWQAPSGVSVSLKDQDELCPPGYRRPNNGDPSKVVKNNIAADAAKSEFMVSLYQHPQVGDNNKEIPSSVGTDPTTGIVRYEEQFLSNAKYGLYADGFFDRRPFQKVDREGNADDIEGVCITDARAAFRGVVFFNPRTYASVFFPASGRRDGGTGRLQFRGATAYYYASTRGNQWYPEGEGSEYLNRLVWMFEFNDYPAPVSQQAGHATSIRCVQE